MPTYDINLSDTGNMKQAMIEIAQGQSHNAHKKTDQHHNCLA